MKRLKAGLLVAAIAIVVSAAAYAESPTKGITNEVLAEKGNFYVLGGIGYGWRGFEVSGGAEYIVQKFEIPGFPLSLGVMGLAGLDLGYSIDISAAGMATLHWSMKAYKDFPEFFQKFDWYIGLGLGVGILPFGLGISSGGGVSYSMNKKLAIDLHSFYVNHFVGGSSGVGGTLGIRYKL